MAENISELFITMIYNLTFSIFLLFLFFYYRSFRAKPGTVYSEIELSIWQSIKKVFEIDDLDLAGHIKLEGYLYLNFIKYLGFFLLFSSVFALLTLIPIYTQMEISYNSTITNLSISTERISNKNLIIPALCSLILALGTFFLVYSYILLPSLHPTLFPSEETLATMTLQSCTLQFDQLAKEIPFARVPDYISNTLKTLTPEQPLFIKPYPDYTQLIKLYSKRCDLFYKLEKFDSSCFWLQTREAVIHNLQVVEKEIKECGLFCDNRNIGYGFIYCENARSRGKILSAFKASDFILKPAPADCDLIWENLSHHVGISFIMKIATNTLFVVLFLIIFTPLTLSSLISQVLRDLTVDLKFVSQSVSSILLSFFQYLIVPYAIRLLTSRELHYLKSEQATSRMFKYLLYLIMNIIIFPLIGTFTLTVVLQKMVDSELFEWNTYLSRNIEKVGEFFVNFVLSMAFVSNILDLLALSTFFIGHLNKWQAANYIEERRAMMAPEFDFPHEYSKVLTIFTVSLVFSISNPMILPLGVVYMVIKYYTDKYNLLFVYQTSQTELPTTQKTVVTCLLIISSLFQSINSGLFIASGDLALIWLGGILSALSVLTLIVSFLLYKYWQVVQNFTLGELFSIKKDFALRYSHPCEEILTDLLTVF